MINLAPGSLVYRRRFGRDIAPWTTCQILVRFSGALHFGK
jgi:hypothetical protein